MDEPDTYRANVGRHREPQPRLMKAKTYPHLVFADPPASPDRETSKSPREKRAASHPPGETPKVTPDSTTSQGLPNLEIHDAPPVPLEPEVEVIPHPGAPFCTVSLSLFAGPERILRRFSVFAGEPRKSIITAIEPCSPVFKEAQPRPSNSQSRRAKHSVEFKSLIVVHNVFLLLVICCCK